MSAQAALEGSRLRETRKACKCRPRQEGDARIRTADPFITSDVLYQLSYVGVGRILAASRRTGARPGPTVVDSEPPT